MKKIPNEIGQIVDVAERFTMNLDRITNLLTTTKGFNKNISSHEFEAFRKEILRATIVFLHAAFEDALRETVRLKLISCPEDVLDDIPIAGTSPLGQPRKFTLGALGRHRGKFVENLIQESIDQFLDRTSFNSCPQIAGMLEKIKIDVSSLRQYFSDLDKMISRRHQIVHKADRINSAGKSQLAPINNREIGVWVLAVAAFFLELVSLIGHPHVLQLPAVKEIVNKFQDTRIK